nr:serine/threonine-protein kinase [Ktedonobacteraceae bacterium]
MQQEQLILPVGNTVRVPDGKHYVIEKLLGKGGFGAVYLVKDRQDEQKFYALKEVIDPSEQDRNRFTSEAELLKRLHHKALPRIYDVFEHEKLKRVYILMDYIKGRDLEALLSEQPEQCFALPLVIAIMDSIVDALSYMHQQVPPIVHRDIKPANIIVPLTAEEAVLVDFGLAKEYIAGKTTTMIRHGSPGYAALEQYGHGGTTPRTDIYGLGATLYTLLTGVVPADPVTRITESRDFDSLTPASLLNPMVPTAVAKAIQRAMSINERDRFETVEEFWQEITAHATELQEPGQGISVLEPAKLPLRLPQPLTVTEQELKPVAVKTLQKQQRVLPKKRSTVLAVAIVLLLIGIVGSNIAFNMLKHNTAASPIPQTKITATSTLPATKPVGSLQSEFPSMAALYGGTIGDIVSKESTALFLTNVQQNQGNFHGFFSGLGLAGTFTGTVTKTGQIQFTVPIQGGTSILAFKGDIKVGGDIEGTYQVLDQHGQRTGDSGVWNGQPDTSRQ